MSLQTRPLSQTLSIIVVGFTLLIGATARAEDPDPFESRLLPLELVMSFRKDINFTKQQQQALGKMVVATQQAVAEKQWGMQSVYFELMEALDEAVIDEEPTLDLLQQAVGLENEIKLEQVRLLIRVRNLLEPEQIAYLRARLAEGWSKNE